MWVVIQCGATKRGLWTVRSHAEETNMSQESVCLPGSVLQPLPPGEGPRGTPLHCRFFVNGVVLRLVVTRKTLPETQINGLWNVCTRASRAEALVRSSKG
uniref:Uncharacterized protein n=1 Tax=Proboscia inermis TaxID=420281 RepID=A0A7S0C8W7_9STRA